MLVTDFLIIFTHRFFLLFLLFFFFVLFLHRYPLIALFHCRSLQKYIVSFNYHLQWKHARAREFTIFVRCCCFFSCGYTILLTVFNARQANNSICWTFYKYTGTFHFTIFTHSMQRARHYGRALWSPYNINHTIVEMKKKIKLNGRPRITRWLWFSFVSAAVSTMLATAHFIPFYNSSLNWFFFAFELCMLLSRSRE